MTKFKDNKLWFLAALFLSSLVVTSLASCSDDADDDDDSEIVIDYSKSTNMPWEEYGMENVTIVDSGKVSLREVCLNTIAHESANNDNMDTLLVDYAKSLIDSIGRYEQYVNDSLKAVNGENNVLEDYLLMLTWHKFNYKSVSVTGKEITLSGLFVTPDLDMSGRTTPNNFYIGTHVTITSDEECPSNFVLANIASDVGMLAILANALFNHGYVVIPDYEGYGITKDVPHPYLNREVTAKQVIDGAKAGLAMATTWGELKAMMKMKKDWKSVSIGYSQGGATAAATYRYALEHPDECKSLRMAGAVCGDGPYDPVATLKDYVSEGRVFMPVAVALILKGMCDTDPEMLRLGCRIEDFCTPGFINTGIFKSIQTKMKNTGVIGNELLDYSYYHDDFTMTRVMRTGGLTDILPYKKFTEEEIRSKTSNAQWGKGSRDIWCNIDQMLNEDCINFFRTGTVKDDTLRKKLRALLRCMKRNQLFYGAQGDWIAPAGSKFTFFHSKTDEVVPYVNMSSMMDVWGKDKALYIGFDFNPNQWKTMLFNMVKDVTHHSPFDTDWGTHGQCGTLFFLGKARGLADDITKDEWKNGYTDDNGLGSLTSIVSMISDI